MKKVGDFYSMGRIWSMALLLSVVAVVAAGCGGGGRDPILGSGGATTAIAPTVTATVPVAKTPAVSGVAINSKITATFSEAMDPSTLVTPAATFTLTGPGATPVSGSVAYIGTMAIFRPASFLAASTTYTATLTTGAKNLAGVALASNFIWSFTTGTTADSSAPMVTSTDPANAATGVVLNKKIAATFSDAMDPLTLSTASYRLTGPGATPVAGSVAYVGTTATFTPSADLAPNTSYSAMVTTGATDLAGNALAANYVWSFTTGTTRDTTAPLVIATGAYGTSGAISGATGLPVNRNSTATFSEAMNALTITTASYTVSGPGATPVAGAVTYVGTAVTFNPIANLAPNTTYTATLTTAATDLAGNALASNYVWSWTTGAATDTTAPTLTSTVPVNAASGVPVNQEVTAVFSEGMAPLTITNTSFILLRHIDLQGLTPVVGTVSYAVGTATFSPSSPLAQNTTYTALITTAATDLAGNAMASGSVSNPWTFTTAAALPTPGPAQVNLDCAANFAILAGSTVTNTGPTIVNGDLGLSPGSAVTGFPPGTVTGGAIHINDTLASNAKLCLTTAYGDAAGRSTAPISVAGNIGGQTLAPGLYKSTSSLDISSGDLTLSGNGVWIFQVASALTTTAGRQVILSGGALASNVFWQVGTSATLGTTSSFQGSILADQSITLNTGATLNGRALTRIGAVTLDSNSVTKP